MSVLQRIFGPGYGPRGGFGGVHGRWGAGSYLGQSVSIEGSKALVPVYNAISQIAGSIGMLPLGVYRREGRFMSEVPGDDAWRLLHDKPNAEMAADELWEIVASHIESWGNAFLWKKPNPDFPAVVGELWPLDPSRCQVAREEDGTRGFWIEGEPFTEQTILHIRGLSLDGLVGYSPIQLARNALAISKQQEKFQSQFLKEGGKPSVVLRHPNALKPDAARRLKASWDNVRSGGTAVLEEAVEVERLTMPLVDAQFVEQVNHSDLRISQIFLLPPDRLGVKSGDSLTYKTQEGEGQRFLSMTLQRRLTRIENSINRDRGLITDPSLVAKFQFNELLRANQKERFESYKFAREAGFLTLDDLRSWEGLPHADPSEVLPAISTAPEPPEPTS